MNKKTCDLPLGSLVKSKAGHDKDVIYVIVGKDESFINVANGDTRFIKTPKRKNPKHVQVIHHLVDYEKMDDVRLKRAIKLYVENHKEEEVICQKQM